MHTSVHLRHDLILGLVDDPAVGRASDVVEDEHLAVGAAAREQGAPVASTDCREPLSRSRTWVSYADPGL